MYLDPSGHFVIAYSIGKIVGDYIRKKYQPWHYSRIEKGKEYYFPENYNDILKGDKLDEYITNVAANCHQFSAENYGDHIKLMSLDGKYEVIYNKITGEKVTDPRDIGTYNYYNPNENGLGHIFVDIVPWIFWGNSEDDTTDFIERIRYMMGIHE
jgi:hypothetical protein